MATEAQLHEAMKTLEDHLAHVKAGLNGMSEDERVEIGKLLEEISLRLGRWRKD